MRKSDVLKIILIGLVVIAFLVTLYKFDLLPLDFEITPSTTSESYINIDPPIIHIETGENITLDVSTIPANTPFIYVNDNIPFFTKDEITKESYEYYSSWDELGRCGPAEACIGKDLMPKEGESRKSLNTKPAGWHTVKYDCVDGKYLYNRCHLIGWQLTAEQDNKYNLITGTRYLNVVGMLPFENQVANYIKQNPNNHVMYRVTPIYDGDNLLATGLLMEAYSVEDEGVGVTFCVYCPNIQPGVIIDYKTGDSRLE